MDNIMLVCADCMKERKEITQKDIVNNISKLLEDKVEELWFKVKLTSETRNEHVWIRVTDINMKDSTFYGFIDNDICIVGDKYKCEDHVTMNFGDIEQIHCG